MILLGYALSNPTDETVIVMIVLTKKIEDTSIAFLKVKLSKNNSLFQADGVGNSSFIIYNS